MRAGTQGQNYLYVRLSRFEPRGAFTHEVVKNRYAFRISATSQALVEYQSSSETDEVDDGNSGC